MNYSLLIGHWRIIEDSLLYVPERCTCEAAKHACAPSFVFSVPSQIQFRSALHHLTTCNKKTCQRLRARIIKGMQHKLSWLLAEDSVLGCIHVQPFLYGATKTTLNRNNFSVVAYHLSRCPKESCAQLRRSLLLSVRNELNASQEPKSLQLTDEP